tara:strand:+ start:241 stop:609 length:369 start_codon:yes stop_codon:yes gene_type:complete
MTRPLPLLCLFLFFLWLGVQIPSSWMWMIFVVALAGLVGLIIMMRYRGMYHGPNTLVDDFKTSSKAFLRDRNGEAERLEELRRKREAAAELDRVTADENDDEVSSPEQRSAMRDRNHDVDKA